MLKLLPSTTLISLMRYLSRLKPIVVKKEFFVASTALEMNSRYSEDSTFYCGNLSNALLILTKTYSCKKRRILCNSYCAIQLC